ncbi:MAG: PEGA domain-containing protein [Acidobacteriota bacterium]
MLLAIGVVMIALLAPRVRAQSADALKKAQTAFDEAQVAYLAGKYDDAAKGFQDAYAARPFPQFLYNVGASYHMKGKKTSDVEAYTKAVEFYKRYLSEEPTATDKDKVQKTIGVLEAEIQRLKDAAKHPEPGAGSGSGSGSAAAAPQAPSQEVQQLGDVKVRGLVVIVTEPQNATVYLDDPKKPPLAQTPWSGSIDGEHKLYIEKRGFRPVETTISADPTKLVQVIVPMSQDSTFAWIDVTSNVKDADVYIDDHGVAPFKAPLGKSIKPGKHTVWISAEGYDEFREDVDIAAGETKSIKGSLKGSPVGKLDVVGLGIEDSQILVDGKVLCERGPCMRSVPEGDHTITVKRPDYKTYSKQIYVQAKSETTMRMAMKPEPGHGDAVWAYAIAAIFGGGGIYCGLQANKLHDDLQKAIAAGTPPVDSNDPRFLRGKIYSIAADAGYGIAGIALLTAIYKTFKETGAPSQASIDIKALALRPEVSSQYAGAGLEVHW